MKELLLFLVQRLVDEPDAVRVEEVEDPEQDAVVYRLQVAPGDFGKVIGREGRIVRALRAVVRAGSAKRGRRQLLELVDG